MGENKDRNKKKQETNRISQKEHVIIGSSSSTIAALLIQRNVEKGKQISIPSANTSANNSDKSKKSD